MINYHLRKANIVTNFWRSKFAENLAFLITHQWQILEDMKKLKFEILMYDLEVHLANKNSVNIYKKD